MLGKINIILGTTASGKTDLGVSLSKKLKGEVINADSMQVYKEIPILTAQPTQGEMQGIPHHLFGFISCLENFDVKRWVDLITPAIKVIRDAGKTPILVGGTGMYVKSLVEGIAEVPEINEDAKQAFREEYSKHTVEFLYKELQKLDRDLAARLKPGDRQRILRGLEVMLCTGKSIRYWQNQAFTPVFSRDEFNIIWLKRDRRETYERINKRFLTMIDKGVLAEVKAVLDMQGQSQLPRAHGLPELINFYKGELTLGEAIQKAQQNTRNYAKRQLTWFRHQIVFDEIIEV